LDRDSGNTRKNRNMNIELLRIILMIMIVTLHYLSHGGILDSTPPGSRNYFFVWSLEALSYIGVDGFVLISGYYLVSSEFKMRKLLALIVQIVFTSAVIYFIFVALRLAPLTRGDTFGAFFPILTGKYWFVTSYMGLYCLSPFLNIVINTVTKRQLQALVLLLGAMFCSWRMFFPQLTTMNTDGGYNVVWLVCLYVFAAYLRLYWNYKINKLLYLAVYFFCCAFVFWKKCTGTGVFLSYVSVPVTVAAISLFLFFREVKIKNTVCNKVICFISPLTFGVYLISENIWLRRELYTRILHTFLFIHSPEIVYIIPASIIAIFIGSMLIEQVRYFVFKPFLNSDWFQDACDKISSTLAA
jgi:surface polysaccharide O-acyltransferase-like enzyme